MAQAAQVLSYLSRLAPKPRQTSQQSWRVVARGQDVAWYPDAGEFGMPDVSSVRSKDALLRLASIDALQSERLLRVGWVWIAGKTKIVRDGQASSRSTNLYLPVFVRTVTFSGAGRTLDLQWHDDTAVHPNFVEVPGFVDLVEPYTNEFLSGEEPSAVAMSQLRAALALIGAHDLIDMDPPANPFGSRMSAKRYLSRGAGVYMDRAVKPPVAAQQLQRWATVDVGSTAFAQIYGLASPPASEHRDHPRTSPLPLNGKQRSAIKRLAEEPVVTIAGPPGTGKSHAAVAVACEAIHRGHSVLIATKSDHAAESICELLDRFETPAYVRFGSDQHRRKAIDRLGAQTAQFDKQQRAEVERRAAAARSWLQHALGRVESTLRREESFRHAQEFQAANVGAAAAAPGVFDKSLDIHEVEHLLEQLQSAGWWNRLRRASRDRKLRKLVKARRDATLADIEQALRVGRADLDSRHGLENETVNMGADWAGLEQAEAEERAATAALLVAEQAGGLNRRQRRDSGAAAAALGSVLRAGKGRRAELLATSVGDDFLSAAPLWVGTLDEIETTLPATAALFDLVIFDEASQIDQLSATPALCRAERVVVVGDPKQLRHVSFVSDDESDAARAAEGIVPGALSQLLDVRRNSLFDIAAAAAPTTQLDEHFRSIPHLIDFSNQRFYNGSLRLMTQHPRVEGVDAIRHRRLAGERNGDGVVVAEVDAIIALLRHMIATGDHRSVGVITPFRAQADALLEAASAALPLSDIRSLDLRVGTVHALQGTERDLVIVSLGLGPGDLGRSLRFVEDPNLFNVMVTRARHQIAVYHSFDPEGLPLGLLRDWFLSGDLPPGGVEGEQARNMWTASVARELAATGLRVIADYPVAGWTVDLAVGEGEWAFGVETGLHPGGIDEHIERHLTLRRAGWHLVDAFESRWLLRDGEVVARLAALAEQRRTAE